MFLSYCSLSVGYYLPWRRSVLSVTVCRGLLQFLPYTKVHDVTGSPWVHLPNFRWFYSLESPTLVRKMHSKLVEAHSLCFVQLRWSSHSSYCITHFVSIRLELFSTSAIDSISGTSKQDHQEMRDGTGRSLSEQLSLAGYMRRITCYYLYAIWREVLREVRYAGCLEIGWIEPATLLTVFAWWLRKSITYCLPIATCLYDAFLCWHVLGNMVVTGWLAQLIHSLDWFDSKSWPSLIKVRNDLEVAV